MSKVSMHGVQKMPLGEVGESSDFNGDHKMLEIPESWGTCQDTCRQDVVLAQKRVVCSNQQNRKVLEI